MYYTFINRIICIVILFINALVLFKKKKKHDRNKRVTREITLHLGAFSSFFMAELKIDRIAIERND